MTGMPFVWRITEPPWSGMSIAAHNVWVTKHEHLLLEGGSACRIYQKGCWLR
jgi:hypothetical protein